MAEFHGGTNAGLHPRIECVSVVYPYLFGGRSAAVHKFIIMLVYEF
ncbi:hypothetical protein SOHN41_01305 [Shewanella sp. HN-41]|nr:hypothetical protein SOHN41_01305 [Shewanella sp. HN-41]